MIYTFCIVTVDVADHRAGALAAAIVFIVLILVAITVSGLTVAYFLK